MTDIFFSYSSKDRERVRPAQEALTGLGYDVFWDQEVPPGQDWDTWIRGHLESSRCVIVFWSQNSISSGNVRHEATRAAEQGILIPILLDTLKAEQFPMGHYTIQGANLAHWDGDIRDTQWQKALAAIESRVPQPNLGRLREVLKKTQAELAELKSGHRRPWLSLAIGAVAVILAGAGGFYAGRTMSGPAESTEGKTAARGETGQPSISDVNSTARELSDKADDFYYGRNGVTKDLTQAYSFYSKAAARNYPYAMFSAGYMLQLGEGVARNDGEAAKWLLKAAEAKHPDAMYYIGTYYANGRGGLPVDLEKANGWYQRATAARNSQAPYSLASNLDDGKGIDVDRAKAAQLMLTALKRGNQFARTQMETNSGVWSREFRVEFQKQLKAEGKFTGETNGTFGPDTLAAIRAVFASEK
jgi:TPR repeat protein